MAAISPSDVRWRLGITWTSLIKLDRKTGAMTWPWLARCSELYGGVPMAPFHGGNTGSSPVGRTNDFNSLQLSQTRACPDITTDMHRLIPILQVK